MAKQGYLETGDLKVTGPSEADRPVAGNDQMIVKHDIETARGVRDLVCEVAIGSRRRWATGGMIVDHASGLSKLLILCHYSGSWEMMVPRIGIGCSCPIMIITPDHRSVRRVVWKHGTALYSYRPIHQARRWDRAPPYQL